MSSTRQSRRETAKARQRFSRARLAEKQYGRQLHAVAREVGNIVQGFTHENLRQELTGMVDALHKYAGILTPWARSVATRMLAEVAARDEKAWRGHAEEMGTLMRREIRQAPIGEVVRRSMAEQVDLITSLPREAAVRVQSLAVRSLSTGERPEAIAREIMRTGEVTASRAATIARTEVGRASTALTQARAEYVDSEGYIWRDAGDGDVRPSHRRMEGRFVRWDSPPMLDGLTGHAGALPNCRCYPEPVLPREIN